MSKGLADNVRLLSWSSVSCSHGSDRIHTTTHSRICGGFNNNVANWLTWNECTHIMHVNMRLYQGLIWPNFRIVSTYIYPSFCFYSSLRGSNWLVQVLHCAHTKNNLSNALHLLFFINIIRVYKPRQKELSLINKDCYNVER